MEELYLVTLSANGMYDADPLDEHEDGDWGCCLKWYVIKASSETAAKEIAKQWK